VYSLGRKCVLSIPARNWQDCVILFNPIITRALSLQRDTLTGVHLEALPRCREPDFRSDSLAVGAYWTRTSFGKPRLSRNGAVREGIGRTVVYLCISSASTAAAAFARGNLDRRSRQADRSESARAANGILYMLRSGRPHQHAGVRLTGELREIHRVQDPRHRAARLGGAADKCRKRRTGACSST